MVAVELDDEIVAAMGAPNGKLDQLAQELIVLELHRERKISLGKAAALLGMPLLDYIRFSGDRGVPYLNWDREDWEMEREAIERLSRP
jgi:predicted HTH domain antitoxin